MSIVGLMECSSKGGVDGFALYVWHKNADRKPTLHSCAIGGCS